MFFKKLKRKKKAYLFIFFRSTTHKNLPKKMPEPAMDLSSSQTNFYYGAPQPYAESIAPSHHSTYAHYYDDDDDGWEMPNFYNETYMKGNFLNLFKLCNS